MTEPLPKILIADDDENNLDFFEEVLRSENFGVAKARDGFEALERFSQYQPDLVLLDVAMPRLNGFQVCAQLKRNPQAHTIPIMLLTGLEEREARRNAFLMGADDFLIKPVERVELLTRIRGLFRIRRCYLALDQQLALVTSAGLEVKELQSCLAQLAAVAPAPPPPALARALAACKRLDEILLTT